MIERPARPRSPFPFCAPAASLARSVGWGGLCVLLAAAAGCKTANAPTSGTLAGTTASNAIVPGIAVVYDGMHDLGTNRIDFGQGLSPDFYTLLGNLGRMAGTGGYESSSPEDCEAWEKKVTNAPRIPAGTQCHVEVIGTGRVSADKNGSALILHPLANGKGMSAWQSQQSPLKPKSPAQPVTDGPPKGPNTGLDTVTTYAAMKQAFEHFNTSRDTGTRDCLNNPKTGAWTDIQAHYYCILPYTIRYCYSTVLAETRDPKQAVSYCADPNNESDWKAKRDSMFHAYSPGSADWQWLLKEQKGVFVYLMFSRAGVNDFNIEQSNDVINRYYRDVRNMERPRRAVDPWPAWLPEQPRYDVLRAAQSAGGNVTPPSVPPVTPSPVKPTPTPTNAGAVAQSTASLTAGVYVETQDLEAVTCTVKLTRKFTGANGEEVAELTSGGGDCYIDGVQRRTDLKAFVKCQGGACQYVVENLPVPFSRPVTIKKGSVIEVMGQKKTFTWQPR